MATKTRICVNRGHPVNQHRYPDTWIESQECVNALYTCSAVELWSSEDYSASSHSTSSVPLSRLEYLVRFVSLV